MVYKILLQGGHGDLDGELPGKLRPHQGFLHVEGLLPARHGGQLLVVGMPEVHLGIKGLGYPGLFPIPELHGRPLRGRAGNDPALRIGKRNDHGLSQSCKAEAFPAPF